MCIKTCLVLSEEKQQGKDKHSRFRIVHKAMSCKRTKWIKDVPNPHFDSQVEARQIHSNNFSALKGGLSKEHFSDRKVAMDPHGLNGTMQKIEYKNSPFKKGSVNRGAMLTVDGYSTMHETIPKVQEKNQLMSYGKNSFSGSSLVFHFDPQQNSNVSIMEIVENPIEAKDHISPERCSKLQLYKLKSS